LWPLNADNTPNCGYYEYDNYNLFNLKVGVEKDRWRLTVYADNVTDARPIINQRSFDPFPVQTLVSPTPRTIGVSVDVRF